ncbi:hypothetical protein [Microbacterium sp. NIBRBAC000506063]|uniref:hypothetical protein n=1 Tax=Microbacterium sp. NIBRBAC000506063 TaxID=2734618 RepID=UPI001BB7DC95|nr:hypothetical protein [Microbacterium sp. NIBRBAC000506063]QTV80566.1 hypothetical protein KAE78_06845 [Microbacterium sp. NIBRBAC000506063]
MLNNKVVCNEILQHHISVPPIVFIKNKGRMVVYGDPAPVPRCRTRSRSCRRPARCS